MRKEWAIAGLGALGLLLAFGEQFKPASDPNSQAGEQGDARRIVRKTLRDPDSAQFGAIDLRLVQVEGRSSALHVACGTVNAKNGFGGYTGFKRFVAYPEKSVALVESADDSGAFAMMWQKSCAA